MGKPPPLNVEVALILTVQCCGLGPDDGDNLRVIFVSQGTSSSGLISSTIQQTSPFHTGLFAEHFLFQALLGRILTKPDTEQSLFEGKPLRQRV